VDACWKSLLPDSLHSMLLPLSTTCRNFRHATQSTVRKIKNYVLPRIEKCLT